MSVIPLARKPEVSLKILASCSLFFNGMRVKIEPGLKSNEPQMTSF